MKISIITVCFNSKNTIRNTIESILSQTYDDIEYIIVDGVSNDGTLQIIQEYQTKISLILIEPDRGIYDAINKGIGLATGDIVGILNSDDVFETEYTIRDVIETFQNNPTADLVFGDVVFVSNDNSQQIKRYYSAQKFKPWKLQFGWMPPHTGSFVRRKIYLIHGLYNINYVISSDYEIFVRWLMIKKIRYKYINKVLVRMRQGGISTSGFKNSLLLNREIVRACKENGIYTNFMFILTKIPFKLLELIKRPKNFYD